MEVATAQAALPRSVEEIRADFPLLAREFERQAASSTSTTPRPRRSRQSVIEAIDSYYRRSNANIHRSMHQLAAEAERAVRGRAREGRAARSARGRAEIVFVRNATEAINLVRFTWAREQRRRRRRGADHARWSTTRTSSPGSCCARSSGAQLEYLSVDGDGTLDLDELDAQLAGRQREAASRVAHVSNVLGHDQPGRRDRRSARTPPARWCWSTARRRCRRCRSTCSRAGRRLLRLHRPQDARARPGSACSGRAASCSRRCRRSWAAGR